MTLELRPTGHKRYGANVYEVVIDGEVKGHLQKDQLPATAISKEERFWVVLQSTGTRHERYMNMFFKERGPTSWDTFKEAKAALEAEFGQEAADD